jgi:hypothetical protein
VLTAPVAWTGSAAHNLEALFTWDNNLADGIFYAESVTPAGVTAPNAQISLNPPTSGSGVLYRRVDSPERKQGERAPSRNLTCCAYRRRAGCANCCPASTDDGVEIKRTGAKARTARQSQPP